MAFLHTEQAPLFVMVVNNSNALLKFQELMVGVQYQATICLSFTGMTVGEV